MLVFDQKSILKARFHLQWSRMLSISQLKPFLACLTVWYLSYKWSESWLWWHIQIQYTNMKLRVLHTSNRNKLTVNIRNYLDRHSTSRLTDSTPSKEPSKMATRLKLIPWWWLHCGCQCAQSSTHMAKNDIHAFQLQGPHMVKETSTWSPGVLIHH